ncbi:MAG TPA: SRPBCC domain-containing protein [Nocardioidaceae bacterium]|nr:SRPBCC domain-containing protein [Nocardioidaceae bacterium]
MTEIAPIRRSVEVRASVETAFALFTSHITAWWPLAHFSVFGADALVAFEGDRVVERRGDQESVWAEVTEWDPPRALRLAWHPGRDQAEATDVHVTFAADDDVTLVTLVHTGWEVLDEPAAAAEGYSQGWPLVLAGYASRVNPATAADNGAATGAEAPQAQWYALVHTPGPALDEGESIFANPNFAEHVAFLQRLGERGLLVAAGPVVPERGEGMAIVRVPAELAGEVDIVELATKDDKCVAGGYLDAEVRPWDVRFTG